MGGPNSGRQAGFSRFATVEEFCAYELRASVIQRYIPQDASGSVSWLRDRQEISSVSIERGHEAIVISYEVREQTRSRVVIEEVLLVTTQCNLGGERFCLRCPTCDRRTRAIFLVGPPFQCRVCLDLRYESQKQWYGPRILTRGRRLADRLGGQGDAFSFGPRPKGMHRRTVVQSAVHIHERWVWGYVAKQDESAKFNRLRTKESPAVHSLPGRFLERERVRSEIAAPITHREGGAPLYTNVLYTNTHGSALRAGASKNVNNI